MVRAAESPILTPLPALPTPTHPPHVLASPALPWLASEAGVSSGRSSAVSRGQTADSRGRPFGGESRTRTAHPPFPFTPLPLGL